MAIVSSVSETRWDLYGEVVRNFTIITSFVLRSENISSLKILRSKTKRKRDIEFIIELPGFICTRKSSYMVIRWRNREIYIYACEDARKKPEKHNEREENKRFFDTGSITIFITMIDIVVLVTIAHNLVSRLDNIPEFVTFFVHERSFCSFFFSFLSCFYSRKVSFFLYLFTSLFYHFWIVTIVATSQKR